MLHESAREQYAQAAAAWSGALCCKIMSAAHAGPMAVWVTANLAYAGVLKQVAPLEAQLAALTDSLNESQARLTQCQQDLTQLDEQV